MEKCRLARMSKGALRHVLTILFCIRQFEIVTEFNFHYFHYLTVFVFVLWSLLITYKYRNKIFKIELKHSKNGKNALMKVYIAQIVYFVSFVCIVNVCLYCLICPYCLHCQYCQYFLNALYRKYMFLYCLVLCCIVLTLNIWSSIETW